ncbi:hypothetical protein ACLK1T_13820 [Escherichia coli]
MALCAGGDALCGGPFAGSGSGADPRYRPLYVKARALTNLVGDGVATIVVAKWVKELDHKKLDDVLNNSAPDGKTHELSS